MPKYLMTFEKGESVRWLGHLDILRTFERAIRRAGLPIAFSSGFNPRERLAFAAPLSTGVTGASEPMTIELTASIDCHQIVAQLNESLPPGIQVHTCEEIPDAGSRDLLNGFKRAEYRVVCSVPPAPATDPAAAAIGLLALTEIVVTREREGRVKRSDIRPHLHDLRVLTSNERPDRITLDMTVGQGEQVMARPGEVVTALSEFLPGLTLRRAHRTRLIAMEPTTESHVSASEASADHEAAA